MHASFQAARLHGFGVMEETHTQTFIIIAICILLQWSSLVKMTVTASEDCITV